MIAPFWHFQLHFLRKREVFSLLLFCFTVCFPFFLFGVSRPGQQDYNPGYTQNFGQKSGLSDALQDTKDTVSNLRYQVNNHEHEIREFEEKLKSLDAIIESLRDEHGDTLKSHKEQLKSSSAIVEGKITSLESISNGLVSDLRQFKTCVNDTGATLSQVKQKIADLEAHIDVQNQNIEHLQSAMRSLMEAMNGKAPSKQSFEPTENLEDNTYRVKAGDSLEKIAKAHRTTAQVLKSLNNLSSDKIVVGKVLKLPEK